MRQCDEFTLGNLELGAGFQRLYQDQINWPDGELAKKMRENRTSGVQRDFIRAAIQACLRHG
jgi:hypothetical protein